MLIRNGRLTIDDSEIAAPEYDPVAAAAYEDEQRKKKANKANKTKMRQKAIPKPEPHADQETVAIDDSSRAISLPE